MQSRKQPSPRQNGRSFRILAQDAEIALVEKLLQAQGFQFAAEPFCPLSRRLVSEPFPLGRSAAAFFGWIYIQDRSSMLPPLALAPQPGDTVLDMCASPGSKTGLLAQLVGAGGLVVGNEPNPARLATLRRNLHQMNLMQVVTLCRHAESLPMPDGLFSRIVLDPPCSGWGTTDKHPKMLDLWQADRVDPLIRLQKNLLAEAARLLAPGGRLVYSTCTTNVEENEAQALYACEHLGLELAPLPPFAGFSYQPPALGMDGTLCVDEAASEAQGFFIALLTKPGEPHTPPSAETQVSKYAQLGPHALPELGLDLSLLPPGHIGLFSGTAHMLPEEALRLLPPALNWQGMVMGKHNGKQFRPTSRLRAFSHEECAMAPRIDLDSLESLTGLLQGQSLHTAIQGNLARLFWQDLPLGFGTLRNGRLMWAER